MKKLFLHAVFLLPAIILFGNDGDYAVSRIAPALLKNANAVIRLEETRYEVINGKDAVRTTHYVITILNENANDLAEFSEYYDKLQDINSVEGYLYDANGKQLKKMKFKDLQDYSGTGDESLISDARVKVHNFYYRVYPYTIEYEAEVRLKQTMFFPGWIPQENEKISVESSLFSIICPQEYQFRYKAFNYPRDPEIVTEKNKRITTWAAKDLPAITWEAKGPDWTELAITLLTGPTDFSIGDYKGTMNTWQDLGTFQYSLNRGRDVLPEKVRSDIHSLVDGISDVRKKIQILYSYMQKNTRYISVQLGIGGWQPFDATYVAQKGYGDCKALSNFMYSILKEAGIPSNYTLIKSGAGAKSFAPDFPSRQFNHAILSVPLEKDTMWLECTSQDLPAGYLSAFTEDRYALAVNEKGSKLVRTPKYGLSENVEVRKLKASLNEDASLQVQVQTSYRGLEQDDVHGIINNLSKDKVREYLQRQLDFATYELDKFEYEETKTMLPEVDEKLDLYVSNYATITGKRLFIIPNVMSRSYELLKTDQERKYNIVLRSEFKHLDTLEIAIPKGYTPESLPQPVSIETKFGKYSASTKLVNDTIFYYRTREQYSGTFPPADFAALTKYYESIYKADRSKIVLVKPAQ